MPLKFPVRIPRYFIDSRAMISEVRMPAICVDLARGILYKLFLGCFYAAEKIAGCVPGASALNFHRHLSGIVPSEAHP